MGLNLVYPADLRRVRTPTGDGAAAPRPGGASAARPGNGGAGGTSGDQSAPSPDALRASTAARSAWCLATSSPRRPAAPAAAQCPDRTF
jgi:hypothetical protein